MGINRLESLFALLASVVVTLLAEWLLIQQQYLSGILLYSILLVFLLLYVAYRWGNEQRSLAVLTIPAVIRLLNFTLPLAGLSPLFAQVVIAFPLILSGSIFIWLYDWPWNPIQFQWRQSLLYLASMAVGSGIGFVLYQVKQPPASSASSPFLLFFYAFVLLVFMALLEEWLFREIMQGALLELVGRNSAILVVAMVYAVMHVNQGTWIYVLLVFGFALGLGWLRTRSTGLMQVFLVHGTANLVFYLLLPWR